MTKITVPAKGLEDWQILAIQADEEDAVISIQVQGSCWPDIPAGSVVWGKSHQNKPLPDNALIIHEEQLWHCSRSTVSPVLAYRLIRVDLGKMKLVKESDPLMWHEVSRVFVPDPDDFPRGLGFAGFKERRK